MTTTAETIWSYLFNGDVRAFTPQELNRFFAKYEVTKNATVK